MHVLTNYNLHHVVTFKTNEPQKCDEISQYKPTKITAKNS